MSPTQRALAHCMANGWTAAIVEKWNQHARIRQDMLGCIDLVVMDGEGGGPLGVQVTSGSHVAARVAKAKEEPRLRAWLAAPARFEVWGYRQLVARKKDGTKAKRKAWELRRVVVSEQEIA